MKIRIMRIGHKISMIFCSYIFIFIMVMKCLIMYSSTGEIYLEMVELVHILENSNDNNRIHSFMTR